MGSTSQTEPRASADLMVRWGGGDGGGGGRLPHYTSPSVTNPISTAWCVRVEVWWTSHSSGLATQIGGKIKNERKERKECAVTATAASILTGTDWMRLSFILSYILF